MQYILQEKRRKRVNTMSFIINFSIITFICFAVAKPAKAIIKSTINMFKEGESMTSTKSKRIIIIRILVAISLLMLIVNIIYRITHPMTGVASMYSPSGLQFHCCIAAVILSLTLKKKGRHYSSPVYPSLTH